MSELICYLIIILGFVDFFGAFYLGDGFIESIIYFVGIVFGEVLLVLVLGSLYCRLTEKDDQPAPRPSIEKLSQRTVKGDQESWKELVDRFKEIEEAKPKPRKMSIEQAVSSNEALVHTSKYPSERDDIYKCLQKHGFNKTYKKYYPIQYKQYLSRLIKRVIRLHP